MPRGKFSASRRSNSAFAQGKGQDSGYGKWIEHGMILTYIKYHQVLSLLTTVCQKNKQQKMRSSGRNKTMPCFMSWNYAIYAARRVSVLCMTHLQMSSTSRVKLETQAASFANDTIEIHRISSYTTLPVSKN